MSRKVGHIEILIEYVALIIGGLTVSM